mgnify:CR=1 FL=1
MDDVVGRLAVRERNFHAAGWQRRIGLQGGAVHSVPAHCAPDLGAVGVVANAADQKWRGAKGREVPGHVEGGAAQDAPPVRELVEQHFSEHAQHVICGSILHQAGAFTSGRKS